MKLFDMKIPKKTKKDREKEMTIGSNGDEEQYPYGLALTFNKNEVAKIGSLKNIASGAKVKIQAVGKITRVETTDAEKGRDRHEVRIQIQKVGIEDQSKTKEQIFDEAIK